MSRKSDRMSVKEQSEHKEAEKEEEDKEELELRRRGRKRKKTPFDALSPKSRRRMQNREYCKVNRRKKKEYITELESTIDRMEQEIVRLNNIIDKYRFKIGVHVIGEEKDFSEYTELQEQRRQQTIKSLQEGKDKAELQEKITQFSKVSSFASVDRRKLIKSAIRVIIENLIPSRLRVLFGVLNTQTNPSLKDIKSLFKCDAKRFQVEIKDPKFDEIDKLHYKMKMDPEVHYKGRQNQFNFGPYKKSLQECVHSLIKIRNKIFNIQNAYNKSAGPQENGLTPENIILFYQESKKMENEKRYDIFNTWEITKTERSAQPDEEGNVNEDLLDLSDIEEEKDMDSQI